MSCCAILNQRGARDSRARLDLVMFCLSGKFPRKRSGLMCLEDAEDEAGSIDGARRFFGHRATSALRRTRWHPLTPR